MNKEQLYTKLDDYMKTTSFNRDRETDIGCSWTCEMKVDRGFKLDRNRKFLVAIAKVSQFEDECLVYISIDGIGIAELYISSVEELDTLFIQSRIKPRNG